MVCAGARGVLVACGMLASVARMSVRLASTDCIDTKKLRPERRV